MKNVVIKGGHLADSQSEYCTDWLFMPYETIELNSKRFPTPHTHGTGCTFSACITAELAKGFSVPEAVNGKNYIAAAIPILWASGQGTGRSTTGRIGTNNAFRPIVIDCIFQTA